ncbi:hypothetical protein BDP27DRAFT_1362204 [Rhodocollybia butyracea]|uniref:Uncharacterized protein n=1 Tax=Rhodocollybia butyracea TaxID=206335 RepID=A0A9P5PVZ7_9AGAR|nr:hypothetical protein BDP27DRAFT_1362204 [Rhodocollybia butyracea]
MDNAIEGYNRSARTTCSVPQLQGYCRQFGLLKNLKRRGTAYLDALRQFSNDPPRWKLHRERPTQRPSLKTKKKPTYSKNQRIEAGKERKVEIEGWVAKVNVLVNDPYGIVPSMSNSAAIFNRKKHAAQGHISSETTKLFSSLATLEQNSIFYEKFSMTLSRGRNITFSMKDIREYPSVNMPKLSPLQYLQKLQAFWDDDLPTWDPQNICPTIGGEKLAVKYWKEVFAKAGHWRESRIRTQWHGWKALMSGLESHGNSVERFLQVHRDREQGLGIKMIVKHLREQKRKDPESIRTLLISNSKSWSKKQSPWCFNNEVMRIVEKGYSHGGGQKEPSNTKHSAQNRKVLEGILVNSAVRRLSGIVNSAYKKFSPNMYEEYKECNARLHDWKPSLHQNFKNSVFAATTIKYSDENAQTVADDHYDHVNHAPGSCTISNVGDHGDTRGGEIFPTASSIIIQSAILRIRIYLSNLASVVTPLLTRYSAGALFRYVYNGFRNDKDRLARATAQELQEWKQESTQRWKRSLEKFRVWLPNESVSKSKE